MKVFTFVGETRRERVVFDGTEEDARLYLERNFPRLHVEPGSPDEPVPDAILEDDNGGRTFYNGRDWADYEPPTNTSTRTSQPDDRDTRIAELEQLLANAQSKTVSQEPPAGEQLPIH